MKYLIPKMLFCLTSLFITGCFSPRCYFPPEIANIAHGCRNEARAKINSTGASLQEKVDCRVVLHPATHNFGGEWCWYQPELNAYVGGTFTSQSIQIACNPNNRADIGVEFLTHEMAHYWIVSNMNDWGHNARYDRFFKNWAASRQYDLRRSFQSSSNRIIHYDFVKEKP